MKTALQELIDLIKFTDKECYSIMFNEGIFDKSLEKEKEQIINAYYGLPIDNDALLPKDNKAEEYYNQTYLENKS